ncbi:MAG: VWA domain-containing protein, partial [Leptotrichiaceae bacterium]|nr:VWA domain-containing protein [Leptotrichiaceae bacterium]
TLNLPKIQNALTSIQPTGWTSIASSIENGVNDLKKMQGEKTLNILYIITDGIETCGGNPMEIAEKLKTENIDVVLGIIGFNVDANQDRELNKIAKTAGGYYSPANDADKLIYELQRIHELAFSDYKWEILDDRLIEKVASGQRRGLIFNEPLKSSSLAEKNSFFTILLYASRSPSNNPKYAGLFEYNSEVEKKLKKMRDEREEKIKILYEEEYKKIEEESEKYLEYLKSRKGEVVAYMPSTSRRDPSSKYFSGFSNKGGTRKESEKDAENLKDSQK